MNVLMQWIWGIIIFLSFGGLIIGLETSDIQLIRITLLIIFIGIPTLIALKDNKD